MIICKGGGEQQKPCGFEGEGLDKKHVRLLEGSRFLNLEKVDTWFMYDPLF